MIVNASIDIKREHYYEGDLRLNQMIEELQDPDPDAGLYQEPAQYVLIWKAFQGGSVEITLDEDGLRSLRNACTSMLEL